MAILKVVNVKVGKNANLKGIINYVLQPKKTEEQLTSGYCCDVPNALETFMETKQCFGKTRGRQYYHFVQSFPPNENITAKQVHDVAVKFAERCKKFRGFEMIIVTHQERQHLHSHYILNSVSFIDGHKFHITRKELALMKELQNQICIEMGYSAAPKKGIDMFGNKRTSVSASNSKTYRAIKNSVNKPKRSFLANCSEAFQKAVKLAKSKEQFIQLMKAQGFETDWRDNKKHITFTDMQLKQQGEKMCKTRLYKLAQYFPQLQDFKTKEELLYGIYNKRNHLTTVNSNQRKNGSNGSIIDFNARFEQYSAEVNRKRTECAAAEHARQAAENARNNSERTTEKRPDNTRSIAEDTGYSGMSW